MQDFDIVCSDDDCEKSFTARLEHEDCGDGSEHTVKCPVCGQRTTFDITYLPAAVGERKAT